MVNVVVRIRGTDWMLDRKFNSRIDFWITLDYSKWFTVKDTNDNMLVNVSAAEMIIFTETKLDELQSS